MDVKKRKKKWWDSILISWYPKEQKINSKLIEEKSFIYQNFLFAAICFCTFQCPPVPFTNVYVNKMQDNKARKKSEQ